jgi:PAS domain S-box-containing protein
LAIQPENAAGVTASANGPESLLLRTNAAFFALASERSVLEGRMSEAIPRILEVGVRTLGVDRASAWLLAGDDSELIRLACTYDAASGAVSATGTESPYRAPGYLRALRSERVLPIADVSTDPRVTEFLEAYRREGKVVSSLDAPMYSEGTLAGLICLERFSGPPRAWTAEEQGFARALADVFTVVVEASHRREVQGVLSRLEQERKLILDRIEDVVVHLGSSMEVVWANRSAVEALRMRPDSSGVSWAGLWGNMEVDDDEAALISAMSRCEEVTGELRFPDGRFRLATLLRLSSDSDETKGYAILAHDVTEKRFSSQLLESTSRLVEAGLSAPDSQALFRSIHEIISEIVPADNFYIAIYNSGKDLLTFPYYIDRFEKGAVPRKPGRGFTEIVLRTGKPMFFTRNQMAQLISEGQIQLMGTLSEWWHGVPLSVQGRVVGVMTVQNYTEGTALSETQRGLLLSLSGTAAMVIERKRSEEALRESEVRYRNLVERANEGIVTASEGFIWFANQKLADMLGYTIAEMEGKPFKQFFTPSQAEVVYSRHMRRLQGEDLPSVYETALQHRDGREVPAELSATVMMEGGKPIILALLRDISERKRMEEERTLLESQIQHSQKLESLGILAGGIAHDFNNLLMGILGNAGLALMELPAESPVRRTLERLETAALRAAELTNQLLAYSGRGKFVVEPVNLNVLIEEMVNLLQAAVPKNVVLRLDLSKNVPVIEGDATQLRQVVMNLIMNAAEAIGDRSGVITISSGVTAVDRAYLAGTYLDEDMPEGLYSYVEVSDTGCGMDEKTRARIFDPFFTTKFTGRGLGLAAVLGIVRGHKGTLKVYSEPQRGSTFKILLPSVGELVPESMQHGEPPAPGAPGGGLVLVVDDEETVRTVARIALEKAGFKVMTAVDGREALEVFHRESARIDLVLLDMTMPHLSGEETFRELRRMRQDVRVVLSSGYNEMDAVSKFAGKGLAGFIQKPYRPVDLIARVRSVLVPGASGGRRGGPPGDLGA